MKSPTFKFASVRVHNIDALLAHIVVWVVLVLTALAHQQPNGAGSPALFHPILSATSIAMERNCHNPDVRELYLMGLPKLTFAKVMSPSSRHTSEHDAIDSFEIKPFTPLAQLDATYTHEDFASGSMILATQDVQSGHVVFCSEADIRILTINYFEDILRLGAVDRIMRLHSECSYTNKLGETFKADHWVIYSKGHPVNFIEIKSPESDAVSALPAKRPRVEGVHVLEDVNILGQVYDEILNLHSFQGKEHVFAILSTLKDFRVVWLPRSNDYAMSPELYRDEPVGDLVGEFTHRKLCGTGVLSHTSPGLTQIMMSAILKSAASPSLPVHAFHARRVYMRMNATAWTWYYLGEEADGLHNSATLHMSSTAREASHFTIIRSVSRAHDRRVWLALAGGTNMLCVVKQMTSVALVDTEVRIWHDVLGQRAVFATSVQGAAAVVMPIAVLMHVVAGQVRYNTDFTSWAVDENVTAGPVPPLVLAQLTTVATMLDEGYFAGGIMEVANNAINKCAMAGVLHTDLEWRHFGVVPVFDTSGTITSLLEVVIDFENCQENVNPADALKTMRERLDDLAACVEV